MLHRCRIWSDTGSFCVGGKSKKLISQHDTEGLFSCSSSTSSSPRLNQNVSGNSNQSLSRFNYLSYFNEIDDNDDDDSNITQLNTEIERCFLLKENQITSINLEGLLKKWFAV